MMYFHQLKKLMAKEDNAQVSESNVTTKKSSIALEATSDLPERRQCHCSCGQGEVHSNQSSLQEELTS